MLSLRSPRPLVRKIGGSALLALALTAAGIAYAAGSSTRLPSVPDASDRFTLTIDIATRGRIGEAYNVGGRNERTNLQVVERICDLVDAAVPTKTSRRSLIKFVTDRPGHDKRYAIDPTKIETELDWQSQVDVEEGLKRTVRWYLDNAEWLENVTSKDYQKWINLNYAAA